MTNIETGSKNDRIEQSLNLTTGSCLKHYFKTASTPLSMLSEISSGFHQSAGLTPEMRTTSSKAHQVLWQTKCFPNLCRCGHTIQSVQDHIGRVVQLPWLPFTNLSSRAQFARSPIRCNFIGYNFLSTTFSQPASALRLLDSSFFDEYYNKQHLRYHFYDLLRRLAYSSRYFNLLGCCAYSLEKGKN